MRRRGWFSTLYETDFLMTGYLPDGRRGWVHVWEEKEAGGELGPLLIDADCTAYFSVDNGYDWDVMRFELAESQ